MNGIVIPRVRAVAEVWEKEAEQRQARTPNDPAAEALRSCASELKARLEEIDRETATLTVAQYATAHSVDPSTVRRLCKNGLLEGAVMGADNEWRIPRDARRLAKAKVRA